MRALGLLVLSSNIVFADINFLSMNFDTMASTLGNAVVANARNGAALEHNPAGLAFSKDFSLQAAYHQLNEYLSARALYLTYAFTPNFAVGTFARTFQNQDSAQIVDFAATSKPLQMKDFDLGLSASYRIENYAFGLTGRFIRLQLSDEISYTANVTAGFEWQTPLSFLNNRMLKLGIALRNIGPPLQFFEHGDQQLQPWEIAIGMAVRVTTFVEILTEIDYTIEKGLKSKLAVAIAPEYFFSPRLALSASRFGYDLTMGVSIAYSGHTSLSLNAGASLFGGGLSDGTFVGAELKSALGFGARRHVRPSAIMPASSSSAVEAHELFAYHLVKPLEPYKPKHAVTKLQGFSFGDIKENGYTKRLRRLRRVAMQESDASFVSTMVSAGTSRRSVRRRLRVLIEFRGDFKNSLHWFRRFASIFEASSHVLAIPAAEGDEPRDRNQELIADLKIVLRKIDSIHEIRAKVFDQYQNQVLQTRIFDTGDRLSNELQIATYFAGSLKNLSAFTSYEISVDRQPWPVDFEIAQGTKPLQRIKKYDSQLTFDATRNGIEAYFGKAVEVVEVGRKENFSISLSQTLRHEFSGAADHLTIWKTYQDNTLIRERHLEQGFMRKVLVFDRSERVQEILTDERLQGFFNRREFYSNDKIFSKAIDDDGDHLFEETHHFHWRGNVREKNGHSLPLPKKQRAFTRAQLAVCFGKQALIHELRSLIVVRPLKAYQCSNAINPGLVHEGKDPLIHVSIFELGDTIFAYYRIYQPKTLVPTDAAQFRAASLEEALRIAREKVSSFMRI